MKLFFSLLAVTFLSTSLHAREVADDGKPLLAKTSMNGYVPSEQMKENECFVYSNKVVLKQTAGELSTTKEQPLTIKGAIKKLLKAAAKVKPIETPASTDGPITRYLGYVDKDELKLLSRGSETLKNPAPEAATLVEFIDANCPLEDFAKN